jgi:hypothetical protein
MNHREHLFQLIQKVESEHSYARLAIQLLEDEVHHKSEFANRHALNLGPLQNLQQNLSHTYVVRLYAEFESGLRAYWRDWLNRSDRNQPMADLLWSITTSHLIPTDVYRCADQVRVFRNSLVHEGAVPTVTFSLPECRHHLCNFLGFLSPRW